MLSMLTVLKSYVVFQFLLLCATSLDLSRPLAPSRALCTKFSTYSWSYSSRGRAYASVKWLSCDPSDLYHSRIYFRVSIRIPFFSLPHL